MRFLFGTRGWLAALAAILLAAGACDDQVSVSGDGGPDGSTDTDSDTDVDTDSDADGDAGPDAAACFVDPERIFEDVAYFAGEDLEGRYPGSEGNEAAMQRAEELFEELGLEPVGDDDTYRQAFDFDAWGIQETPAVSLDGEALEAGTEYAVFNYSGTAEITAEVVYVGYGMTVPAYDPVDYPDCPLPATGYDDYEGLDVTDGIVLVVRHGPGDDDTVPDTCPDNGLCGTDACLWNFTYKAANAALHGAAAMIVVQNYDNPAEILAGASVSGGYVADLASVWMDRDVVEAAIPDLQTWTDGIDAIPHSPDRHATGVNATIDVAAAVTTVLTGNVLGAIIGTDPEIGGEVVIVGGHIDHLGVDGTTGEIYPGADDNASGSAVTMELARLLSECATPARTIVFALWNGEEEGLLGSAEYAQFPAFQISSTYAAYSVDMVGVGDGSGVALYGTTESQNSWLLDVMQGSATEMGYDWDAEAAVPIDTLGYGSDNLPFDYLGVPNAMATTLGEHTTYHTPADTAATITLDDLEASAAMMYAGLLPLVEGTEEAYLPDGKGRTLSHDPAVMDYRTRLVTDR
ncbi:MAG: M28 family peptidase [Proteobacteria bacterium]|jgi:hypothetical protein|nr:M28 family peptidase [Pseudomonadota bacterium]